MQGTTINIQRKIKYYIIILLELNYIMKYNNFFFILQYNGTIPSEYPIEVFTTTFSLNHVLCHLFGFEIYIDAFATVYAQITGNCIVP